MSSFTYAFKRQWAFGLFLFGATRKISLGILAPKVWCVYVFISPGFTLGEALLSHSIGRNLACSSWRLSQRCTVYIPIVSAGGSQVHVLSTARYSQLLLWDITLESESKICSESLEYRSLQCIDFRKTGIPALCWELFVSWACYETLFVPPLCIPLSSNASFSSLGNAFPLKLSQIVYLNSYMLYKDPKCTWTRNIYYSIHAKIEITQTSTREWLPGWDACVCYGTLHG